MYVSDSSKIQTVYVTSFSSSIAGGINTCMDSVSRMHKLVTEKCGWRQLRGAAHCGQLAHSEFASCIEMHAMMQAENRIPAARTYSRFVSACLSGPESLSSKIQTVYVTSFSNLKLYYTIGVHMRRVYKPRARASSIYSSQ